MNVLLWTGGKDCLFSYYKIISKGEKIDICICLLNKDGRTFNHNLKKEIIDKQADAIGMPPILYITTPFSTFSVDDYDIKEKFRMMFSLLYKLNKTMKIDNIITGQTMSEYTLLIKKACEKLKINNINPLFMHDKKASIIEFLNLGFQAIIIRTESMVDKKWLGEKIDLNNKEFFEYISDKNSRFLEGFHTLVIDGPIFLKRLEIIESRPLIKDGISILDILKIETISKLDI